MTKRFLFPDCNIFLHYTSFADIDWAALADVDNVELVLPYSVISTLDKKKYDSADAAVRNRARKVIAKLSSHEDGSPIRENVTLFLLDQEPIMDYAQQGLNHESEDDRIIAEILRYQEMYSDREIAVVTADGGMRLKCKRRNIPLLEIPEDYRLPDRLDAYSKQIKELQARIAELESTEPILRLTFPSGERFTKFQLRPPRLLSDSEIQRRLQEKREELLKLRTQTPCYATANNYWLVEQAAAKETLADYQSYMEKVNEYAIHMAKVIDLRFVLTNTGNASAEDTDVYIYADRKFPIANNDELPKRPKTPEQRKRDSVIAGIAGLVRPVPSTEKPNVSGPMITRTPREQVVRFHVQRLKQGTRAVLDNVHADFSAVSEAKSFGLRYSLNSHSLPTDVGGELHVLIEAS